MYLFLPSAILLLAAVIGSTLVVTAVRTTLTVYVLFAFGVLALLTLWGLHLRYESDRSGSVGVMDDSTIVRPVVAHLREPVFLNSPDSICYDEAAAEVK